MWTYTHTHTHFNNFRKLLYQVKYTSPPHRGGMRHTPCGKGTPACRVARIRAVTIAPPQLNNNTHTSATHFVQFNVYMFFVHCKTNIVCPESHTPLHPVHIHTPASVSTACA